MNYNLMPFKYFVDAVQTQGFNSAAKRNYVSETAISNAISKLEQQIGHRLINRSSGNLTLTTYGHGFYQRAEAILYSYEELWHHIDRDPTSYFSLGKINLCLLFNSQDLQTAGSPQELAQNSTLYLHQGQTTDVNPIKTGLISLYQRHG